MTAVSIGGGLDLPVELAPTLRAAAERLVAECGVTHPPVPRSRRTARRSHAPRCVECGRGGRLGGHHRADGTVVWIHKGCHRRLHRAGRR